MSKLDLSKEAEISISFLSDLTNGKANPSLKIMEAIADALETPLPMLLETTDLSQDEITTLSGGKHIKSLPTGYERVCVILPEHQAYIAKKWGAATAQKLKDRK